jgi:hypothetical protein
MTGNGAQPEIAVPQVGCKVRGFQLFFGDTQQNQKNKGATAVKAVAPLLN